MAERIGSPLVVVAAGADGVLFTGIEFSRLVRFKVSEEMPNLTRWLAAMRERASATAGV